MNSFKENKTGLAYLYLVVIMGLIALVFFALFFGTVIQNVQEAFNPMLSVDKWVDTNHFNVFYLATTLLSNLWTYIFVFVFFGLVYFAYLFSQRRGK